MNIIYFDVCALCIYLIIMISNALRKMNRGRVNVIFNSILGMCVVITIASIVNGYLYGVCEYSEQNLHLAYVFQYIYYLGFINLLPVYTFLIFSIIGIWHLFRTNYFLLSTWALLAINLNCVLFLNFITNGVFSFDEKLCMQRGILIWGVILLVALCAVFDCVMLIKYRKLIKTDRFVVLLALYPISLSGVIIQIFNNKYRVEMLGIAIALLLFSIIIHGRDEIIDPITGAKKYNAGIDRMINILATRTPVTIILFKVVNYKNIRVYLGQEVYNQFLRQISSKMRTVAYKNALAADVFYLEYGLFAYLTEEVNEDQIRPAAQEMLGYFQDEIMINSLVVMADARCCTVRCPEDIDEYTTLFTFGTTFHSTMPESHEIMRYSDYVDDEQFKIKNELDEIIARGLEHRTFEMYYQPIYSMIEDKFVCAEALIRLNDEKYGMISPALFIHTAEISGAIHKIGDFVLEEVCRFASTKEYRALGLKCIEINMSASQCIEIDLVDKIKRLLDKYNLDAGTIKLEITESAADFDPEIVDANVSELSELGISFALDDYGTGYSNVRRVTKLPIDLVKLDRSFVDDIDDPQMWIMVQETIKMLKEMGKEVLVEGVEEERVVEKFLSLGCDYIQGCEYMQGFYFCKPLPEKEFLEFMQTQVG